MKQKGFTVWFTGLPYSGKKQLAGMLSAKLQSIGIKNKILDGGTIRRQFDENLGYSKNEVYKNIRRICFECQMLTNNEVAAIAVTISPFRALRKECREKISAFIEVYCSCSIDVLKKRDVNRLYEKAERGEISDVAGISAPYEEPKNPDVTFASDRETPEQGLGKILHFLIQNHYIQESPKKVLTDEEEEIIRRSLRTKNIY